MTITLQVRKRNRDIVAFDSVRIYEAVIKAFSNTKTSEPVRDDDIKKLIDYIVKTIEDTKWQDNLVGVEEIQDIVEKALVDFGHSDVHRAYVSYRQTRKADRLLRVAFMGDKGLDNELNLSKPAISVLQQRCLRKNSDGQLVESVKEMFQRVADAVASVEPKEERKQWSDKFMKAMTSLDFLPNSPTLMNAGTDMDNLSACFVLDIQDSMESIMKAAADCAHVFKSGGGVGLDFSPLRQEGALVQSSGGQSTGPLAFMELIDTVARVVAQGGKRRGALMGILRVDHPDILKFIEVKNDLTKLNNFNISVAVTDKFMKAVKKHRSWELRAPHTGELVDKLRATDLFNQICASARRTGDPGLIFIDTINKSNVLKNVKIRACNPCGEIAMPEYEACVLGSINIRNCVNTEKWTFDFEKFKELVWLGVRFLDNIIDAGGYPLSAIEQTVKKRRRIGLGIMGFADALALMDIPYGSSQSLEFIDHLMGGMRRESERASEYLAEIRGEFSDFENTKLKKPRRNIALRTIAPTGTLSMIAACSSGIEPHFSHRLVRSLSAGTFLDPNNTFVTVLKKYGIDPDVVFAEMGNDDSGSVQGVASIPNNLKKVLRIAHEISPKDHLEVQATFQQYLDNCLSKTINLPSNAHVADIKTIYMKAWEVGCRGITVFRDGCRGSQVLHSDVSSCTECAV